MKQCKKCMELKDESEFGVNNQIKDKKHYYCKSCSSELAKKWQRENQERKREYDVTYKAENKESITARERRYYYQHRDKYKQAAKNWYRNNTRRSRETHKKWIKSNPEKIMSLGRKWIENNRKKITARHHAARTNKNGGGSFTEQEFQELCDKYGNKCLCCGEHKPLTVDHVVPVVSGGSSNISNIQCLCKSCNSKKGTKTIDYRQK